MYVLNFDCSGGRGGIMVINAIFNNISVLSWRSILFEPETGVSGENHSH